MGRSGEGDRGGSSDCVNWGCDIPTCAKDAVRGRIGVSAISVVPLSVFGLAVVMDDSVRFSGRGAASAK